MKSVENLFIQGLILSLTTQLAWTLIEPEAAASQPKGIVGTLYRSAAMKASSNEKEGTELGTGLSRGQRCVRCGTGGYGSYGGDRYYGDYYYNKDYYNRGSYYGREDPLYYGRDQYYGRDRNWYYQQDPRNPYDRNPYDRYSYNTYDDRYYGRTSPYEYDPYNGNTNSNNNYYNSYRGNGYDNLNPSYYEAMRDRFQRDRGYGSDQYYDRYNDRPAYRGYYDNRNFRPYDETYSTAYGGRPQSLGSSYLFERTDDEANAAGAGMPPPALTGDKKQESANMEMKKE